MEHISTYLSPKLTRADIDMIDYAKFSIVDDPVQLSYDFLEEFVQRRKVLSLELMLLVIESIIRSSGKVKRGVFRLDPSKGDPAAGKIIFVKWLSYAINVMEKKRNSSQKILVSNGDCAEEMIVASVMDLICSLTEVIQKPRQIEVLKTKFGVDWNFLVDKVLDFAKTNNISTIQTKAANAKLFLEMIHAGEVTEQYVPEVVPPYKVTLEKKRTTNAQPTTGTPTKELPTKELPTKETPVALQPDGTWNSNSNSNKSAGWHLYKGPIRKATLRVGNGRTSSDRKVDTTTSSVQPHSPYSARESNTSNYKRGNPDESDSGQRKRGRPNDSTPHGGKSEIPRQYSSYSSVANQPTGRGRGMVLPAWMTQNTATAVPNTSSALGNAASSVPQSVEMGRGRGRGRTMPAWMTQSQNANASGVNPESDQRDQSRPYYSSENDRGGLGGGGTATAVPNTSSALGNAASSVPQSVEMGRGRGRGRTMPAWMTQSQNANASGVNPESDQRDQSRPYYSSENDRGGQGGGGRNFPSSTGIGRGRERTLPAWQTGATNSVRDDPSDGNQSGSAGRGRGRGMTLPSWMTNKTE